MINTKKPKFGISSVLSTIILSIGILFLIFAVENSVKWNFLMSISFFIGFFVLTITSYVLYEHPKAVSGILAGLRDALYGIVLEFFKGVNSKIGSKLSVRFMEKETSEHVHLLGIVFCVVFPASLLYVFADFYYFKENALDSMLFGLLVFLYSNFLPDLPSIYRRKKDNASAKDLAWYKKYAILLLTPLLIWAFYSGIRLRWRTTESFHNFKSLTVYGAFLFLLGFFVFGDLPILIGDITEIVSLPLYGLIGYLTHLKVDKVW